jgi:hypothetical protein
MTVAEKTRAPEVVEKQPAGFVRPEVVDPAVREFLRKVRSIELSKEHWVDMEWKV